MLLMFSPPGSNRLAEKKPIRKLVKRKRRSMNECSAKMGIDISIKLPQLEHTQVIKEPAVYAFPKGPVPRKYWRWPQACCLVTRKFIVDFKNCPSEGALLDNRGNSLLFTFL
jgi:hypothetical protein